MVRKSSGGFSVVELMVVLAIIGVIASFAIPQYLLYVETAQATACLVERGQTNRMIIAYNSDHQAAPLTSLAQLAGDGYFEEVPNCPHGGQWVLVPSSENNGTPVVGCSIHFWPGEGDGGASSAGLLGSDDFSSGDASGWTETGRDWEVVDGVYIGGKENGSAYRNRTFFGDESWTDYTVELDASLMNGEGNAYGYGVYFRAQDYGDLNSYIFQYDAGYGDDGAFLIREIADGREMSPFARVDAPEGYVWNGETKHITIEVSGTDYAVYVSDVNGGTSPAVSGSDSSYTSGAIGLRTWGSAQAGFDNVEVSGN